MAIGFCGSAPHQVHPLPGHRRLYRGHRGHHLRQPAQGVARPDPGGQGAGTDRSQAGGARGCAADGQRRGGGGGAAHGRRDRRLAALSAALAGVADRGRPRRRGKLGLGLPVETIGTRFGGIPNSLPAPELPDISFDKMMAVLPAAFAFALLGAIESLLSAVVADGMSGRRHRSNCELVAQGVANIASALFGGICVTGTIARTATNVRAGARGPVVGHAARGVPAAVHARGRSLASYIPLSALAAVLAVVAWNMAEKHEFATLLRASRGDAVVLLATFLLVVFRDLTEGILVGFGIGALLFLHRMAQAVEIESAVPLLDEDRADTVERQRPQALRCRHGNRSGRDGLSDLRGVLLRRGGNRRGRARPSGGASEGLCARLSRTCRCWTRRRRPRSRASSARRTARVQRSI